MLDTLSCQLQCSNEVHLSETEQDLHQLEIKQFHVKFTAIHHFSLKDNMSYVVNPPKQTVYTMCFNSLIIKLI